MKPLITLYYQDKPSSVVANMTPIQRADSQAKAEAKHPIFRVRLTQSICNDKVHLSSEARQNYFEEAKRCRFYLNKIRTGEEMDD
ncbi:MAG: hypothetical protein NT086_17480 [Proteobacteria bacterium]|nr:hypothetical protein [Pseudomonadota bacterium]